MESRRFLLYTLAGLPLLLSSCSAGLIDQSPPATRIEIIPAAPSPQMVWIGGHYGYRNQQYVWMNGRYAQPHGRKEWAPGHYVPVRAKYRFVKGHWK